MREYDLLVKRFSISEERKDIRIARLCTSMFNANGVKRKKDKQDFTIDDFLPQKEKRKPNWQNQLKMVEALNASFGGKDKR